MAKGISREQVAATYRLPFLDLVFRAQVTHRQHHPPNRVQFSTLLSIKTGGCPEDCGYCSQSAHWDTGLARETMLEPQPVLAAARRAKACGSTRFCMGAAWRRVPEGEMPALERLVREVKDLGLETCVTLGTVSPSQIARLRDAGLDYYNHNLDTSREHYADIVTTRDYDERLGTLAVVRASGVKVCCGGILGLGETEEDRIGLLWELANLEVPPESVPINSLVPIPGTPLADQGVAPVDPFDFVRTIAAARVLLPTSWIRLSAGREQMSDELQALCFMAGANSIFAGDRLLTTSNPGFEKDRELFARLGIEPVELGDAVDV